ncbi:hypothetical protein [Haloarcula nitratireducens]|uniref:AI-2E family transporter n=1 Tax=Haloarcula nitratireducens TaxID=2487749 RepID=A0AAW4PJI4_9EURY|nr:hypothetical protein [Halomicroarcula nitratireducens]MBX0297387.1 hypothetical protein [Halomicroarcula nitratireducens]
MSAADVVELAARRIVGFILFIGVLLVSVAIPLFAFETLTPKFVGLIVAILFSRWVGRRLIGLE